MKVYERIKQEMVKKRLSQNALAKKAQISQSGLCSIVNGSVSPKQDTLRRIAQALGVTVGYLVGQSDDKKPAHEMSRQELLSQIDIKFSQLPQDLKAQAMAYVAGRLASRKEQ